MATQITKWDDWQLRLIAHKGSVTLRKGRQVGGSAATSKRISDQMQEYTGTKRLIIAPSDRQSSELFIKTQGWLEVKNHSLINSAGGYVAKPRLSYASNLKLRREFEFRHGIYNEIPTKELIVLKKDFSKPPNTRDNVGSVCYSLPAGKTGVYLRTYTLDFLDCDEAAYIPRPVYTAVRPMLAISEKEKGLGWETLISSPFGKGGFFYDSHHDSSYLQFHVSAEDCPRISREFLRKERARLTKIEYAQEWLGEFIDEWHQYFATKLLNRCTTMISWALGTDNRAGSKFYLGVDFARLGDDDNAMVIVELLGTNIKVVKVIIAPHDVENPTVDIIGRIEELDSVWHFKKIFVDSGGLGGPIMDILHSRLGKRRIMGLDNATKKIQEQGEEKRRGILKEDLYTNCLLLMETGKLEMISNMSLLRSLKSITYEYGTNRLSRTIKITGKYSHLTEALVRACWCIKERGLSLYMY